MPPSARGSYNRLVGTQISALPEFRQVAISYANHAGRDDSGLNDGVILVDDKGLSFTKRLALGLPERIRQHVFHDIGGRHTLAYAWQVLKQLPRLRPHIVVCYDDYKLGPLLRPIIDWPCRLTPRA